MVWIGYDGNLEDVESGTTGDLKRVLAEFHGRIGDVDVWRTKAFPVGGMGMWTPSM